MWARVAVQRTLQAVTSKSSTRLVLPNACRISIRSFAPTLPIYKDKNESDSKNGVSGTTDEDNVDLNEPRFLSLNTDMTDDEMEAIIAEEEAKMNQEVLDRVVDNWKPGMRKRPLTRTNSLDDFLYELEPGKHQPRWTLRDKRTGALAIKVGMMPVFDEWGVRHASTVLFLDNNVVIGTKTEDKHGYTAVQVAAGQRKRKNVGKSVLGQYKDFISEEDKENPPYLVREFRVSDEAHLLEPGTKIHARHFCPGQNIDVAGTAKGKGFQGAMKRHNFAGMPASHGVSKSHRALGSTGQCQDPGRVFKGKKMAGRMGGKRITVQNLRVLKVDRGRNLLFVAGAVPGNKGAFVEIRDAVKDPLWNTDKVVDGINRPPLPTFDFEADIDGSALAGYEEFMPMPNRDPLAPDPDYETSS